MPERTEYAHGTPSWTDLQTTEPAQAKEFYNALFGWEYDDQAIPGSDAVYSMAQIKGKNVAAIAPLPDEQKAMGIPPHWNSYVTVTDVDATAAAVPAAGGQVMAPPFDVMDAGRMAVIVDPTGAIILPWQPKNNIGAQLVNEHGTFTWSELMTNDVPKAAAFYKAIFGWDAETNEMGPMKYTEWKLNGQTIGGALNPPMEGIPPNWGIYFAVDDCDQTVNVARDNGATLLHDPIDIPAGRFATMTDPNGAAFAFITMGENVS
jgi:predicted enzyme related to lactoylglutathione lyase